jgi:hypothetical protein
MLDRELPDDVEMQGSSAGMRFRTVSSEPVEPRELLSNGRSFPSEAGKWGIPV